MGSHVAHTGLELTATLSLLHIPPECCCIGVHPTPVLYGADPVKFRTTCSPTNILKATVHSHRLHIYFLNDCLFMAFFGSSIE